MSRRHQEVPRQGPPTRGCLVDPIENHLTRIYRKLGYRSRGQLIAAYYTGELDDMPLVAER